MESEKYLLYRPLSLYSLQLQIRRRWLAPRDGFPSAWASVSYRLVRLVRRHRWMVHHRRPHLHQAALAFSCFYALHSHRQEGCWPAEAPVAVEEQEPLEEAAKVAWQPECLMN